MNKKGNNNKILVTKAMIFDELKRHIPNIQASKKTKVKMNNTTIEQLMDLLTKHCLTYPDDMAFIKTKFLKHETVLE